MLGSTGAAERILSCEQWSRCGVAPTSSRSGYPRTSSSGPARVVEICLARRGWRNGYSYVNGGRGVGWRPHPRDTLGSARCESDGGGSRARRRCSSPPQLLLRWAGAQPRERGESLSLSPRCEWGSGGSRAQSMGQLRRSCTCYGVTPSRGRWARASLCRPSARGTAVGVEPNQWGSSAAVALAMGRRPAEGRVLGPVRRTADITLGDWGNTARGAAGREGSPPGSRGECLGLCDEPPKLPWVTGGTRRGVPQAEGSPPGSRGECWGLLELGSATFG